MYVYVIGNYRENYNKDESLLSKTTIYCCSMQQTSAFHANDNAIHDFRVNCQHLACCFLMSSNVISVTTVIYFLFFFSTSIVSRNPMLKTLRWRFAELDYHTIGEFLHFLWVMYMSKRKITTSSSVNSSCIFFFITLSNTFDVFIKSVWSSEACIFIF